MKTIYLLCLHNVRTGGPEAIHQLSDALIEQGFDARLVYYDWNQIAALEHSEPQEAYWFGERANEIEEYARYRVKISGAVPNESDNIVVLPETLCHLAPKFAKATVLIWWLSVDNGFGALSRANLNDLRARNVHHAWQSRYAERFVNTLGFINAGHLGDYTVDLRSYAEPLPSHARPPRIAYNANHKVAADWRLLAQEIIAIDPLAELVKVEGSRAQVAGLFATSRAYCDLGCFPGKDRMPREAALMGCAPLVLAVGAGEDMLMPKIDPSTSPADIARQLTLWLKAPDSTARFAREAADIIGLERSAFFDRSRALAEKLAA